MGNLIIPCKTSKVSDGYHTFEELYQHRMLLYVSLMNSNPEISWKAMKHYDGTMFDGGWFIAGMNLPLQITYHLRIEYWSLLKVDWTEKAPIEWDGHNSDDVLVRLTEWNKKMGD